MAKDKFSDKFYKLMVEYLGEEIFVSDAKGNAMFINKASSDTIGLPREEIIGKNVTELETEGYFAPSCTLEVLRQKKTVNMLQYLKNGGVVLATGVPVFDDNNEKIEMVISTSKDVDAINKLLNKVENQEREIIEKESEIGDLRMELFNKVGFVSADEATRILKNTIIKVAPTDVTVLVEGETGVGKEVVVKSIHQFSKRKDKPLVKINCGLIPSNLIEAELFGYEKGAFTGADQAGKKGKVELANQGTLFLDEIGEMPLDMQVKLLEFLQDNTYTRVGGTKRIKVDTRVITATNRNLQEMCEKGSFRKDLYYRLNIMPLKVPPLRERTDDIEILAKHFIELYNTKYNEYKVYEEGAFDFLKTRDWPGNIREFEHVIERAYIISESNVISIGELCESVVGNIEVSLKNPINCNAIVPLKEAKNEIERQILVKACEKYDTTYKIADALKVDQSTVVKLLKKHRK